MPAKIITLSQKDQDLLRLALNRAIEDFAGLAESFRGHDMDADTAARIKDLKERLV